MSDNGLGSTSLRNAMANCAYDKQCSGVYHTCCTENCFMSTSGRQFLGYQDHPRLQLCPMKSIKNATSNDMDYLYKEYQQCTYQKTNSKRRSNTHAFLLIFWYPENLEVMKYVYELYTALKIFFVLDSY